MGRTLGTVLIVLALTLTACSGTDQATPSRPTTPRHTSSRPPVSTTTSSRPVTPSVKPPVKTRKVPVVVAHPKHVDESTKCDAVVTADDASAAAGGTAAPSGSAPFLCYYSLTRPDGFSGGILTILLFARDPAVSAELTTLFGNTAAQERDDDGSCSFFVALTSRKPLDAKGAALAVHAAVRTGADACGVARELVEKGFARLPDS